MHVCVDSNRMKRVQNVPNECSVLFLCFVVECIGIVKREQDFIMSML